MAPQNEATRPLGSTLRHRRSADSSSGQRVGKPSRDKWPQWKQTHDATWQKLHILSSKKLSRDFLFPHVAQRDALISVYSVTSKWLGTVTSVAMEILHVLQTMQRLCSRFTSQCLITSGQSINWQDTCYLVWTRPLSTDTVVFKPRRGTCAVKQVLFLCQSCSKRSVLLSIYCFLDFAECPSVKGICFSDINYIYSSWIIAGCA